MPIVKNDLLGRPALEIYQDTDGFNFSIDTMLLADFVSITARTKKICDLCSGNAPIPLYLTLRTSADIVGVEVQKESFDLAVQSILANHLDHQINPNDRKAIARHEILATLEDIVREAAELLNTKGRFALVHRPDRLLEIMDLFRKYHIEPKRLRFCYPKLGSSCNHILIEGIKDGSIGGLVVLPPLIIYNENNQWTKEVVRIYNYDKE